MFTHFLPKLGKNRRSERSRESAAVTQSPDQTETHGALSPRLMETAHAVGAQRTEDCVPELDSGQIKPVSGVGFPMSLACMLSLEGSALTANGDQPGL